jgi:translation initiation factor IF-3
MELIGKIKQIGQTKEYGSNGFRKRELVLTTEKQSKDKKYYDHILIEFIQDNCHTLDSYNVGDNVKVSINIKGREWTNKDNEIKFFNSIQGWRIEQDSPVTLQEQNKDRETADPLPF